MSLTAIIHLIILPVSEKVNRSILPSLDDGPASVVHILLTPRLHWPVTPIWFKKIHSTSGMSSLHSMKAVTVRTLKSRRVQEKYLPS